MDKNFITWCRQFFIASSKNNVKNNIGMLSSLLTYSHQLYLDFNRQGLEMGLQHQGLSWYAPPVMHLQDEISRGASGWIIKYQIRGF
jgi:hypothetical protein